MGFSCSSPNAETLTMNMTGRHVLLVDDTLINMT